MERCLISSFNLSVSVEPGDSGSLHPAGGRELCDIRVSVARADPMTTSVQLREPQPRDAQGLPEGHPECCGQPGVTHRAPYAPSLSGKWCPCQVRAQLAAAASFLQAVQTVCNGTIQ